jgi:surfeit locus 1 family protein
MLNSKFAGWLIWLLVYFVVAGILVSLGFWQLQRAELKEVAVGQLSAAADGQIRTTRQLEEALLLSVVSLEGKFISDRHWLLDNQLFKGRFGYRVFTPFCDAVGCVLTDRGWVEGDLDRSLLPQIDTPEGTVRIEGRIGEHQANPVLNDNEISKGWPRRVQILLPEDVRNEEPELVTDRIVHLNPDQAGAYIPIWNPVVMGPDKHRGYAVQWFVMAIAFTALMIWFAVSRMTWLNAE